MSLIRDFLKEKDSDYSKYIPATYKLSEEDKAKVLFINTQRSKYELEVAGKCMKPCFRNMRSSMVSEYESECMIVCQNSLNIL